MALSNYPLENEYNKFVADSNGNVAVRTVDGNSNEAVIVDDYTTTNKTYVGFAVPGSLTASAIWKIKVLDETGNYLIVKWADGNSNYDNVWDNRATTITYT